MHTIELFYDNVLEKKNEAAAAFAGIKAAAKKRIDKGYYDYSD